MSDNPSNQNPWGPRDGDPLPPRQPGDPIPDYPSQNPLGQPQPGQADPYAANPYPADSYQGTQPYGQQAYAGQPVGGFQPNPGYPPMGYAPQPVLASWGRRLMGWLLDWLVPSLVLNTLLGVLVPRSAYWNYNTSSGGVVDDNWPSLLIFLITAIGLAFLNKNGQTPGRRWAGTQLVDAQGQPMKAGGASVGRYLLHIVDEFCFLGWLWPLWDGQRQTFADKIAKTHVIDVRATGPLQGPDTQR